MIKSFLKRHMLLVGFVTVLVPLGVLLAMQYTWLRSLAKTSAIAEKAWLNNYLEVVSAEVAYFYRTQAERALNLPTTLCSQSGSKKLLAAMKKKEVDGVKYLFTVRYYQEDDWGKLYAFDPRSREFGPPTDPAIYRAITVALAPWRTMAHKSASLQSHEPTVDQLDPDNVIILKPISDEGCRIIGVAGMVLDTDYFRQEVLPSVINKALLKYFDERGRENLVLAVRDGRNRLVWGEEVQLETAARGHLDFVFSNWSLTLGTRFATPEQWARSNFLLNMSMSGALAVVLLGGVVLALRTASREMRLGQMKSDFVSNVSHELRTPLASIRVFGEFFRLGRVEPGEKMRRYGEFIETESRRLTQLINNILDFSKIESGAKTYDFETADVQEIVSDTVRTLDVSLRHNGYRVDFQPSPAPLYAEVDADAIAQAVANLVDNAVKYSGGDKRIQVRVRAERERVVIDVQDHGIGISAEEQKKIFDRFHRVSTGLVHDVKGSGLGLSIVNHIVESHGGKVRVASEVGRGSTFSIRLPVRKIRPSDSPGRQRAPIDGVDAVQPLGEPLRSPMRKA